MAVLVVLRIEITYLGYGGGDDLVNNRAAMHVVGAKYKSPKFFICSLKEISRLGLEHRVFGCDIDKLKIILPFSVRNIRKIWISLFAILTDN
jgi:hypothetical protein